MCFLPFPSLEPAGTKASTHSSFPHPSPQVSPRAAGWPTTPLIPLPPLLPPRSSKHPLLLSISPDTFLFALVLWALPCTEVEGHLNTVSRVYPSSTLGHCPNSPLPETVPSGSVRFWLCPQSLLGARWCFASLSMRSKPLWPCLVPSCRSCSQSACPILCFLPFLPPHPHSFRTALFHCSS